MASMSMLMSTVGSSSSWSACAGVVAMRTASSAAAIVRVYLCEVILDCGKRREVFSETEGVVLAADCGSELADEE